MRPGQRLHLRHRKLLILDDCRSSKFPEYAALRCVPDSACHPKRPELLISDDRRTCSEYINAFFTEILQFLFPFFKVHLSKGL